MSEIGEIPAPEKLGIFLRTFTQTAQEAGDALFRLNSIRKLAAVRVQLEFAAWIETDALYGIKLTYQPATGQWSGLCSCSQHRGCPHIYAVGKALLAENSIALVNDLAAGVRSVAPVAPPPSELARRLAEQVRRPLNLLEVSCLRIIHKIYQRYRHSRQVTPRDLSEFGWQLQVPAWQRLPFPKDLPEGEYWFWLGLAQIAQQNGQALPEAMLPITDLAELEHRQAETERKRIAEHWRSVLVRFQTSRVPSASTGEDIDFRVAFGPRSAALEWKPAGHANFEKTKTMVMRALLLENPAGLAELAPEAEAVWQAFVPYFAEYSNSTELNYFDAKHKAVLGRLLCRRALASRTVGSNGQPLRRVEEPLRWSLVQNEDSPQEYRFRLVQANGEPLSDLIFTAGRNPVIYLSSAGVFLGPPAPEHFDVQQENKVPAAAIESDVGIGFLEQLAVAVPERLQARIQRVPVRVQIQCYLDRYYETEGPEICVVEGEASAADDLVNWVWLGSAWHKSAVTAKHAAGRAVGPITVYDTQLLHDVHTHLVKLGARTDAARSGVFLRVTKAFPEMFAHWVESLPEEVEVNLDWELASLMQDAVAGRVRLDVTETEIDWFDLKVVLDISDATLTAAEIKLLLDAKGAFVRLKNKGWRKLHFELTPEDDEQLARLGLTARELSSEPQRMHALQLADPAARKFLPEAQADQIQRRAAEIKVRVTPDIPAGIRADLRPYQREGFHFLAYIAENRFGGILADDMGLGKTLQTLAWLAWLHERWKQSGPTPPPASLVVCPKSVMDNWRAEGTKFAPDFRIHVWAPHELSTLGARMHEADVHVINYAQLRSLGKQVSQLHWLVAILDEGQYIKNPSSQTTQVARALHAEHRLILSGTPIENRLLDLWSLLSFAMPGTLGSRAHFAKLYNAKGDPLARRRLAARVRPFLLRRTKAQVAKDLPDRIEEDLYCEMEGEQQTLYRAELKRAQQILLAIQTQSELAKQQFNFLTSLLRLRQICCHPRLYQPDAAAPGAKLEALLEQLEPLMEEGHKVLVFSQFVELLDLLKPALTERKWPIFYLSGATENRGELVANFQQAEGAAIFLISLKAGGFGLNLTAASYVVLFDPWWNPAVENQAIDRTHRIGQTNKVIAYRLLIKNSIEEKIRQLQKQKSALADDVFGEEKFAQSLTMDDLRYLLSD